MQQETLLEFGDKRASFEASCGIPKLGDLEKGLSEPPGSSFARGRTFPTPLPRLVRTIKAIPGMRGVGVQRRVPTSKLLSLLQKHQLTGSGSTCASSTYERAGKTAVKGRQGSTGDK